MSSNQQRIIKKAADVIIDMLTDSLFDKKGNG